MRCKRQRIVYAASITVDNFYWLNQIDSEQYVWVGEQALHLDQLVRKGYAVIPTVVISARILREFLATIHQREPFFADLADASLRLNVENAQQLQAIARQIRQLIHDTPLSPSWITELGSCLNMLPPIDGKSGDGDPAKSPAMILRPSFALKSAGAASSVSLSGLTSLIEPQVCWKTADEVANGLKRLWTELFRARNLVYLQRAKVSFQDLYLAAIAQPIGSADASGYLQTNSTDWEILATYGLPMAIERGEVLPSVYQIDWRGEEVSSKDAGNQTIVYQIGDVEASPLERTAWNDPQPLVLAPTVLQRFLTLTQQLQSDFNGADSIKVCPAPIALEWQLYQDNLYVTQANYRHLEPAPVALEQDASHAVMMVGIGVSGGRAIARAEVITEQDLPLRLPPETVVVASEILPAWLPLMQQAAAIVAEQGGMTSHSAIVARELGIPAIVGVGKATQQIRTGDWIVVDGDEGKVYEVNTKVNTETNMGVNTELNTVVKSEEVRNVNAKNTVNKRVSSGFAAHGNPAIATQLMVALSQPDLLDRVGHLPVDGVGLLRSELMMVSILEQQHPQHWIEQNRQPELTQRLIEQIQTVAGAFFPRPVFYRSLDLRSHEFQSLQGSQSVAEPNPMLGRRGTFSYVLDPTLFDLELDALRHAIAGGFSNLRLVLPFVRTVEEFTFCRARVNQAGLLHQPQFQLWIMAEVPSALFLLPEFVAAGVQGICIGTNDLTQLMLGADRDQGLLGATLNESHPAVMAAIAQLIHAAQALAIPCSICGHIPTHTDFIDRLVEWGVTSITATVDTVEETYAAIARAEHRLLLNHARTALQK
nr:putative PEP-binding protein [Myxacorys almedinensis]